MIQHINWINIKEILSRILRHPLLQDVTLEQGILYAIDFIGINGMPLFYELKEEDILIKEYKGYLPCDLVEIIGVKDCDTGITLRSMTSMFNPGGKHYKDDMHELQFKVLGRVIYTSFKEGKVHISYKAIKVDSDGFPMIIDNPIFLKALELYIKCLAFTILFDMGKITKYVLDHTELEYSWVAALLLEEFKIPSMAEMETITNMMHLIIKRENEFTKSFDNLGNREFRKIHLS